MLLLLIRKHRQQHCINNTAVTYARMGTETSLKVSCIAAMDLKRGIGKANSLPWRLKKEMHYFTRITSTVEKEGKVNCVLMGRKTWESIPEKYKPLPGRLNIVLSRTLRDVPEGVYVQPDLTSTLNFLLEPTIREKIERIFAVGGAQVYKDVIESPHCDRIYLTKIEGDFDCDTFFPIFDESIYPLSSDPAVPEEQQEEKGIKYTFKLHQKKDLTCDCS